MFTYTRDIVNFASGYALKNFALLGILSDLHKHVILPDFVTFYECEIIIATQMYCICNVMFGFMCMLV
jgi:hypothetical protein